MNTGPPKSSEAGFTLIEMIVALGLFALIGIASSTLVETILTAKSRTDDQLARLGQVQRALYLITLDVSQAAPRSLDLTDKGLVFSRRDNSGLPITLAYSLDDKLLVRTFNAERRQAVLPGIDHIIWRFHVAGLGWRPQPRDDDVKDKSIPDGVELDLFSQKEGGLRIVMDLTSPP